MNVGFRQATVDAELDHWLAATRRLESAHRMTVAWFRSRLPGYPLLKAPQLCRNTPLTTEEWTFELGWTRDERQRGLQFQDKPSDVSALLDASGETSEELIHTTQSVASTLSKTDQWLSFEDEAASLDDSAKEELAVARKHLREALSPASVDAHEPNLALPRNEYRSQTTSDLIGSLTGKARSYSEAFERVNRLITVATSDVFGQLVAFGEPPTLSVTNLDLRGDKSANIQFEAPEHYTVLLDCGNVAWLDDTLVTDAVRIESLSTSLMPTGDGMLRLGAVILDGTADGWQRNRR
ncbi:hypothetical protein [Amycolatopsis sp. NBC_01286]|uniref:hypothetical protein n=1 Tax=Amycolatopsis sp. NBC_01286 TaxID=2903560 RepID=UPI002E159C72|nr:hypothetical protein OG570_44305 [Amycolatopsis sp. NBC_01286]